MNRSIFLRIILAVFPAALAFGTAEAQTLRNPFDFPALLSGNFGELRANHFHSGIDFKTGGVEGKAVHAVRDGYVCRIVTSPWGYGNVLYMMHPDSVMTVYAHLQRFTDEVAEYVEEQQYAQERFAVDLAPAPEQFPFSESDIVGYSGNSGSSGGPHLHFEIRDARTEEPLDPLPFFRETVRDTRPPAARAVMVCPVEGRGVVNGSQRKQKFLPVTAADGRQSVAGKIEAWGKIAFCINVDDYMDGTTNVYGVKEISLSVDGEEIFHSLLDRFSFDETRFLNAFVDYETWREERSFYTKTFVEPGNRLRFIRSRNRGIVTVDEARTYHAVFQLTDAFGNTRRISLEVTGKEQPVAAVDTDRTTAFYRDGENRFGARGIRLFIPRGCLYSHVWFRHEARPDSTRLSDVHVLHNRPVALHRPAQLSLFIRRDTSAVKERCGIVALRNNRPVWIGGTYRDGWVDASITELGAYAVMTDTVAPKITPVDSAQWMKRDMIAFRLTDNLSGVAAYRGEIDGQYALFAMDGKKALISYAVDRRRLTPGEHVLVLTVTDGCGNQSVYETSLTVQ
jgi:hypothetical protein